ncbi:hypothetical protein [Nocardiopsis metallicus]|uniref:Putative membrane protein n=1 Tax=Nocardiopsis metallicus TaxID=179819 RepID=A0A840WF26_9ACTN|nr:hypothetical protein [Nocardiopsis metallicus]MBB5489946.1 putative membrane protein [Nocardiopsis metallicus]
MTAPTDLTAATVTRAVLLGLAAGSRSTLGAAGPLLAGARSRGSRPAQYAIALAVTGELATDKLPCAPSRLAGPGKAVRVLAGGLGGALLARGLGQPVLATAGIAAAAAPVGAAAGVRWRSLWGTGRGAWVGAVVEDAVAIGLARAACAGWPGTRPGRG